MEVSSLTNQHNQVLHVSGLNPKRHFDHRHVPLCKFICGQVPEGATGLDSKELLVI